MTASWLGDVDVLVIAENLPDHLLDRLDILSHRPGRVQPIGWTSQEWRAQLARNNPIATEAVTSGVWLRGTAESVSASRDAL